MNDEKSTKTHEVFSKPGGRLGSVPFWIGLVLIITIIGAAVLFSPKPENASELIPPTQPKTSAGTFRLETN